MNITGILLSLFLLAGTLAPIAGAAPAGPVEIYYIYSYECLGCEQSWPLIKAAMDEAQAQVSLHKYDINSREGAAFASARGISSVPAVVFDDGTMVLFEQYRNPEAFGAAFSEKLKERILHGMPLTIVRNATESESPKGKVAVNVNTCITCSGDRPLKVEVNTGLPEGGTFIAGTGKWTGFLQPGESRHLSSTCELAPGTRTIPPMTVAYDDGTGMCSMVWPETPVIALQELSATAAYIAGLIAGINPCLLAIMAFIGTTAIADTGHRKAVIYRIIAFCGGMLAVYLLIGVGLIELIARVPAVNIVLHALIVLLLICLSAWSFFDAWQTRRGNDSTAFRSVLDRIKPLYVRFGLAASFVTGGAFGLVKMPCVGGIYVAILGTILESGNAAQGVPLLISYNLGVVTPVLLLGTLITVGLSPAAVNQFRLRHRIGLKIFTGALLGLMALTFLLGIM